MIKRTSQVALIALAVVLGCFQLGRADMLINGAGATFPYPIYSKWFDLYAKENPGIHFNYQSIGSGGGIRMFGAKTVDFGASDAPLTDEQIKDLHGKVFHFPTVMGADVIAYNIPGFKGTLRLTGSVIADIFMGKITKWNAPQIGALNPGAKLPDKDIVVCHRSDGSGTTYIFADYLTKVSPAWAKDMGKSTSLKWPVGLGGKGNEGVTALVEQTPGAIGYIDLLIYPKYTDKEKGAQIKKFINWELHEGQKYAPELNYASLPPQVVKLEEKQLTKVVVAGE
jgi:phosphate transport system substrate-binding protein